MKEYDEYGKISQEKVAKYVNGKMSESEVIEYYNEDFISRVTRDANGDGKPESIIEYDDFDSSSYAYPKREKTYKDGKLTSCITREKQGDQYCEEHDKNGDGIIDTRVRYNEAPYYQPERNKKETIDYDVHENATSVKIEYFENNRIVSEEVDNNADSNIDVRRSFEYDNSGKRIGEVTENYTDGKLKDTTKAEFNGQGQIVREETIQYDNEGNKVSSIKKEYSGDGHYTEFVDNNGDGMPEEIKKH